MAGRRTVGTLATALALYALLTADLLLHGPITSADAGVSAWLHERMRPALTQALLAITHMHSTIGLSIMSAAVAAFLIVKRRAQSIGWLLLTVQGGQVLNVLVKHALHRARPSWDHPIIQLTTYSFPSGHTEGSTVFWGFVCLLVWWWPAPPPWKRAMVVIAPVMVALTAFSRVYLGVHYLSDVLAGICEGVAWVCVCAMLRDARTMRA